MILILAIFYLLGAIVTVFALGLLPAIENWGDAVFAVLVTLFWPVVWIVLIPLIVDAHLAARRRLG